MVAANGVVTKVAMPELFSVADPTAMPATENEIVPVGTMPLWVLTATVRVVDCARLIMLGESPRVTCGVTFTAAVTVSNAVSEPPAA
jgi:hypothetical protein